MFPWMYKYLCQLGFKSRDCWIHNLNILLPNTLSLTHFSAANHYLKEIMDFPSDQWTDLKQEFNPIFKKLTADFFASYTFAEFYSRAETEQNMRVRIDFVDILISLFPR